MVDFYGVSTVFIVSMQHEISSTFLYLLTNWGISCVMEPLMRFSVQ